MYLLFRQNGCLHCKYGIARFRTLLHKRVCIRVKRQAAHQDCGYIWYTSVAWSNQKYFYSRIIYSFHVMKHKTNWKLPEKTFKISLQLSVSATWWLQWFPSCYDIWFQFLWEDIVAYIRHCIQIITVPPTDSTFLEFICLAK